MKTHVTFVLDSSGSMSTIREDTIGGYNTFLEDQRDEEGTATVSLYDFNTHVNLVYETCPIEDAPELGSDNYTPSGQTALHDAIYQAITETADHFASMGVEERPDNTIVVILTDGKENASETPQPRVREQIEYRQSEFDWEFLFIGANQDAALTAGGMGIHGEYTLDMAHSGDGAEAAYESTSDRISNAREEGSTGGFEAVDRERQDDARDS